MIEALVAALRGSGLDLDWREVADALWLAQHSSAAVEAAPNRSAQPDAAAGLDAAAGQPDASSLTPAGAARSRPLLSEASRPGGLLSRGPAGNRSAAELVLRISAQDALPGRHEIERALRPLKRVRQAGRADQLDVSATVDHYCETGLLIPVMTPRIEQRFDVAVVVDGTPSMVVWQQTVAVLADLLERHGAFRRVSRWTLHADEAEISVRTPNGFGHEPSELEDPSGRTITLLLTDCVDPMWRADTVWSVLRKWARFAPIALVQMLPRRAWYSTRHGEPIARMRSERQATPTAQLTVTLPWWWDGPSDVVAVPVLTLEEGVLLPWAHMVSGAAGAVVAGVLAAPVDDAGGDEPDASPEELVRRFASTVPQETFRLATWLAAVEVSLPVARLLLEELLPGCGQSHIAEAFASGLLQPVPDSADTYDFLPGVREALQDYLTEPALIDVWRAVAPYLEKATGRSPAFSLLFDPAAAATAEGQDELARIAGAVADRLGLRREPLVSVSPTEPGDADDDAVAESEFEPAGPPAIFAAAILCEASDNSAGSREIEEIHSWLTSSGLVPAEYLRRILFTDFSSQVTGEIPRVVGGGPVLVVISGPSGAVSAAAGTDPSLDVANLVARIASFHAGGVVAFIQGADTVEPTLASSIGRMSSSAPWMLVSWPPGHPRLTTISYAFNQLRDSDAFTGEQLRTALELSPEDYGRLRTTLELQSELTTSAEAPAGIGTELAEQIDGIRRSARESGKTWGGVEIDGQRLDELVFTRVAEVSHIDVASGETSLPAGASSDVVVEALNVARGVATMIRYPGTRYAPDPVTHAILFDGGGPGRRLVARLRELRDEADLSIDLVVLSHMDDDHSRGVLEVFEELATTAEPVLSVQDFWYNTSRELGFDTRTADQYRRREEQLLRNVDMARVTRNANVHGAALVGDAAHAVMLPGGAFATILAPAPDGRRFERSDSPGNAMSMAVLFEVRDRLILLAGDAHVDTMLDALDRFSLGSPHVDLLQLPHYGDARRLSPGFLERVTADVYLVWPNAMFRQPTAETFKMIHQARRGVPYAVQFAARAAEVSEDVLQVLRNQPGVDVRLPGADGGATISYAAMRGAR